MAMASIANWSGWSLHIKTEFLFFCWITCGARGCLWQRDARGPSGDAFCVRKEATARDQNLGGWRRGLHHRQVPGLSSTSEAVQVLAKISCMCALGALVFIGTGSLPNFGAWVASTIPGMWLPSIPTRTWRNLAASLATSPGIALVHPTRFCEDKM